MLLHQTRIPLVGDGRTIRVQGLGAVAQAGVVSRAVGDLHHRQGAGAAAPRAGSQLPAGESGRRRVGEVSPDGRRTFTLLTPFLPVR